MNSSSKKYIMIVLASSGLVAIALGLGINLGGLFISYLVDDFALKRGTVSFSITVYSIAMAVAGLWSVKTVEKYGYRIVTVTAVIIQILATASLSLCKGIVPVIVLNIVRGFCGGLSGMVLASSTINYWFHEKTALMTSIALSFSGLCSAVLSPVISSFLARFGWQRGYLFIAAMVLLLSLPALIFPLTFHPEQSGVQSYGSGQQKAGKSSGSYALGYVDKVIYGFLMVYAVCSAFLTGLPSHFTSYAETAGFTQAGALMVSACMIANTVGKIILGSMLDKIGSRISISAYDILILIGIALMHSAVSQPLLIGSAFLYGLCYSLNTIAITFIIREMFGVEMFSRTYPKLSLMVSLSSAVSTTVVGYLYDVFSSYGIILILMATLCLTAFTMIMLSHRRMKKLSVMK